MSDIQDIKTLREMCERVPAPPGSFTKRHAMEPWLLDYENWFRKLQQLLVEEDNDDEV